ncbi:MAG: hypothetical protein H0X04_04655 [Chthoniobacterales bacterium]|nr:hypothetical protein [Chthoniobacterales bacterium]
MTHPASARWWKQQNCAGRGRYVGFAAGWCRFACGIRAAVSSAVAAFRFSPVRESYANEKYGDTHDVGVIGAAVFRGWKRVPVRFEARAQLKANPFSGRFATPP